MNVWKFLTIKDTPYFWKCSMSKIQDLFSHIEIHLPSEFGAFHFISCYITYYGIKKDHVSAWKFELIWQTQNPIFWNFDVESSPFC